METYGWFGFMFGIVGLSLAAAAMQQITELKRRVEKIEVELRKQPRV